MSSRKLGEKGFLSTRAACLGLCLALQDRPDEAEPFLELARQTMPKRRLDTLNLVHMARAATLMSQGSLGEAEEHARQAFAADRRLGHAELQGRQPRPARRHPRRVAGGRTRRRPPIWKPWSCTSRRRIWSRRGESRAPSKRCVQWPRPAWTSRSRRQSRATSSLCSTHVGARSCRLVSFCVDAFVWCRRSSGSDTVLVTFSAGS